MECGRRDVTALAVPALLMEHAPRVEAGAEGARRRKQLLERMAAVVQCVQAALHGACAVREQSGKSGAGLSSACASLSGWAGRARSSRPALERLDLVRGRLLTPGP